ncbi:MAG TPA: sugar phosphate isomerase/epimerase family protein [Bacteroidales bacterium]|nr:sugar phosphate isomerase/epimerase family protein [Bacteroidales bacterium]
MNRRKFIETSGAAAGAAMLGTVAGAQTLNTGSPVQKTSSAGRIKLGLYSITYGGIWYNGPALTFDEFCRRAKEAGFDGVELDNKRPMGNPMDLDQAKRDKMKNSLARHGLEVPCVAANNDFSSPVPEHRECQLLMVRETARLAKDLGAKVVRLFAAWEGVPIHEGVGTYDFGHDYYGEYNFTRQFPYATLIERYNFVKECLREAARMGEENGVVMALQNHKPLIRHWKDTYDLVREVNSPWLKICLDLPIFENLNRDYVADAVRKVGDLQVHSHYGGEYLRDKDGIVKQKVFESRFGQPLPDYEHYIGLMNEIGYNGYFTFELCHPVLNDDHTRAGLEYVHEQVKLAREYMSRITGSKG